MEFNNYDIVVVGGGPGGIGAAVAAGRAGAKVLLIEREGCLGGGATTMLVNPFMPHSTSVGPNGEEPKVVNGGIYQEILASLIARGGAIAEAPRRFDDEAMKLVLDELVARAGVDVLFHAALFDVQAANGKVQSVRVAHNHGPITVTAKVFIDSTGDGLLSQLAGCQTQLGDETGTVMPMTTNFMIAGLDPARMDQVKDLKQTAAAGGSDTPPLLNTNVSCTSSWRPGVMHFNAIRIPGSTLDPMGLSKAESRGRMLAHNFFAWFKAKFPAPTANAYLAKTGNHIGIRESRRVVGDYVLNGDDFDRCAKFDDAIACCSYPVDIHGQAQGQVTITRLPPGQYYQVPYRCLTPKGMTNLLVASRCISTDVKMHSSVRIMPPLMNIGEAAGFAAAMCLPAGDVRKIDIGKLQAKIRANGGILEPK